MTKKKETKETPRKKPVKKKETESIVGKIVTVKIGEAEFKGECLIERSTNSGKQVYLKLNGLVSRFFNAGDITEVE